MKAGEQKGNRVIFKHTYIFPDILSNTNLSTAIKGFCRYD
jgi:hypothetical protein